MSMIIFDEEERIFSVVEDQREFGIVNAMRGAGRIGTAHVKRNKRAYIDAGSALVGGVAAGAVARAKARKAAREAGLSEEEVKKAGRKAMLKGGAAGAATGLALAEGGQYIHAAMQRDPNGKFLKGKDGKYLKDKNGHRIRERVGFKNAGKQMYVDPAKAAYGKAKGGVTRGWDKVKGAYHSLEAAGQN